MKSVGGSAQGFESWQEYFPIRDKLCNHEGPGIAQEVTRLVVLRSQTASGCLKALALKFWGLFAIYIVMKLTPDNTIKQVEPNCRRKTWDKLPRPLRPARPPPEHSSFDNRLSGVNSSPSFLNMTSPGEPGKTLSLLCGRCSSLTSFSPWEFVRLCTEPRSSGLLRRRICNLSHLPHLAVLPLQILETDRTAPAVRCVVHCRVRAARVRIVQLPVRSHDAAAADHLHCQSGVDLRLPVSMSPLRTFPLC